MVMGGLSIAVTFTKATQILAGAGHPYEPAPGRIGLEGCGL